MENEKDYPIVCPHCKAKIYAHKSLGIALGFLNTGYGRCVKCDKPFLLVFNTEKDEMTTEAISDNKELESE